MSQLHPATGGSSVDIEQQQLQPKEGHQTTWLHPDQGVSDEEDGKHFSAAGQEGGKGTQHALGASSIRSAKEGGGSADLESTTSYPNSPMLARLQRFSSRIGQSWGVESIGIRPLELSERTSMGWWSVSLLWFSANVNVLSFSTGTLASVLEMDMKSSLLTIFFVGGFCCFFPAYFSIFGPKLGIRQMVHCRFSFGYFGTSVICLLNAATMLGYCILNSIVGGQTLSAVSTSYTKDAAGTTIVATSQTLTPDVGIVIAAVISLIVSFSGIRILHYFERYFWIPVMICFLVLIGEAGTGPTGLHVAINQPSPNARSILGLAAIVAGFVISWSALSSDVSHYLRPTVSSWKLFWGVYFGFFLSCVPFLMLGAAFACSSYDIPEWSNALSVSSGQFFSLILVTKLGNFGKFLLTLLALSVSGNISATIYSFGLTFQTMIPIPFITHKVPRFVWPIFAFCIFMPLAIAGHDKFYETLTDFTAVLGYWASLYVGVVFADHTIIRKRSFDSYDTKIWNQWRKLPPGLAALSAAVISLAVVVPSIDQVWFTGPIALKSGDLGFETGLLASFLLYIPLRLLEQKVFGR